MSASRHTYAVTVRGLFTDFLGNVTTVFHVMYGPNGYTPAAFGSKREAEGYAAQMNEAWPNKETPNYVVIQLR